MGIAESTVYAVTIPEAAVPKARPRVAGGRAYTLERTAAWEERVGWAWREAHGQTLLQGPVQVTMTFDGVRESADLDNLVKGCLDGLNGVAWVDDRQVVELRASKRPGGMARTVITVGPWRVVADTKTPRG